MSDARVVWLDGRLVLDDQPHLRVTDRGFQLGDGVFETLRARRGVVIELDEHLARLRESAAGLAFVLPQTDGAFREAVHDLLVVNELLGDGQDGGPVGDASVRITCSRGHLPGRILLPPVDGMVPTVVIQAWPYSPPEARLLSVGVQAVTSSMHRDAASPMTSVKSTSRADHIMARLEASRVGADEAIHLTLDGYLAEATTANVFLVVGGRLLTPRREDGILAGTARGWLLARGVGLGLGVVAAEAVRLELTDLLSADEAFLSASVAGIVPLTRINGRPIGSGLPGPLTTRLREAREQWIDAVSRAEPDRCPAS